MTVSVSSSQRRSRGVTLIEMVYAIVIMGVLAAVLMPLALNGLRVYEEARNQVATLDQIRYAMERMAREIRETRYTDTLPQLVLDPAGNSLVFTRSWLDQGGEGTEEVTLRQTGSELTLAYTSQPMGSVVLLPSVKSLGFVFDADLQALQIRLEVDTSGGNSLVRETVVQLKNRETL